MQEQEQRAILNTQCEDPTLREIALKCSSTDTDDPKPMKLSTESPPPTRDLPTNDMPDPSLPADRIDNEDPIWNIPNVEMEPPYLTKLRTDRLDPSWR